MIPVVFADVVAVGGFEAPEGGGGEDGEDAHGPEGAVEGGDGLDGVGLIEAADPSGNIFGEDRLRARLALCRNLSGAAVISGLLREVENYSGRSQFEDDVCVVTIEAAAK